MKPIFLKIIAFGPYAKEVELNFQDSLHYQDIFVVTGPTGAGKTTIFDAICYALYGETSGAKRKGEELRSDFSARGDLKTKVEFTFSVKDKQYFIARAPKQKQRKKRGDGFTEIPATVEYFEIGSDRLPLTKDIEIRQEIQHILGLNVDQFRKIVMIPQGDFKEFLFANTTSKEELLRKIFATELYKSVQERLQEQAVYLKLKVAQIQHEIRTELALLNTDEAVQLQPLLSENNRLLAVFGAIEEQIQIFKEQDTEIKKELMLQNQAIKYKQEIRQSAQFINDKFEQHQQMAEHLAWLKKQSPLFVKKKQELNAAKKAQELLGLENEFCKQEVVWRDLKKERQVKLEELGEVQQEFILVKKCYEAIAELKQELNTLIEQESQLVLYYEEVKTLDQHQIKVDCLQQQQLETKRLVNDKKVLLNELVALVDLLGGYQTQLEELKTQVFDLQLDRNITESHLKEVQLASEHFVVWQQLLEKSVLMKKKYDQRVVEEQELRENYENQAQLFINAAAIRLANELEVGQACPVCGSTEHPSPRTSEAVILTQNQLNELRSQLNQVIVNVQGCQQEMIAAQLKSEEAKRAINNSYAKLKANHPDLVEASLNQDRLAELNFKLEQVLMKQNQQLQQLINKQKSCQSEIERLLNLKEAQQQLALELKELERIEQDQEIKYATHKETLKSLLTRIPDAYHSLEKLETRIAQVKERRHQFEENIYQSERDYQRVIQQITIIDTTLAHLEQQIKRAQANLKESKQNFNDQVAKSFTTFKLYQDAKRPIEKVEQLMTEVQDYGQELHTAKHVVKQLSIELEGKEPRDLSILDEELENDKKQREQVLQAQLTSRIRCEHYEKVLNSAVKKYEDIKIQEEEYAVVGELAELANGKSVGKMSFETYVLSGYFDSVLEAANQRLIKMTNGRYYLLRREEVKGGGRKGLDLDVYDGHTCHKRPVNTLSGGESFKASLALALGLSDTVQQNAGGIQLDTMFIDEGFGTLDTDSLEQAIDILMDLQDHGRLIGVISHVNELKERIPSKLVVQATPEGSTAYFQN